MKNLRRRVFPLIPVLALLLSIAIGPIKAKTAALLTPCDEEQLASVASSKLTVALEHAAPRPFAIFFLNGIAIIDAVGSTEMFNHSQEGRQFYINPYLEKTEPTTGAAKHELLPQDIFKNVPKSEMAIVSSSATRPMLAHASGGCKRQQSRRRS
jgi:hypothetical protein